MSFTPTILINRNQLEANKLEFEEIDFVDSFGVIGEDEIKATKYIKKEFNSNSFATIQGINIIVCKPELSVLNENVRLLLTEWGVEYSIIN